MGEAALNEATLGEAAINEATVKCPKCGELVPLTAALAAPLLRAKEAEFQTRLAAEQQKSTAANQAAESSLAEAAREKAQLAREREELATHRAGEQARVEAEVARRTRALVDEQVAAQMADERKRIAAAEGQRAAQKYAEQSEDDKRSLDDARQQAALLKVRLDEARKAEAESRRSVQAAEEKAREMELAKEREISARLDGERQKATAAEGERLALQLNDKDRIIREMNAKLEDAVRKSQLGSQQAQGEVLEELLESQLRRRFPYDGIEPVAKGVSGADVLQVVRDETGRECGRILWESKRTQHWQPAWLPKLKTDQRNARADLAVLISQAMPPEVQHFNEVDGVWVSSLSCTLPVATALRASLLQLGMHRRANEGVQSKAELMYEYLNGAQFRGSIEALVTQWDDMQKDLGDEKKATLKRWAKREKQIELLLGTTTGMYGHIQGIAGRDFKTIDGLEDGLLLE